MQRSPNISSASIESRHQETPVMTQKSIEIVAGDACVLLQGDREPSTKHPYNIKRRKTVLTLNHSLMPNKAHNSQDFLALIGLGLKNCLILVSLITI